MVSVPSNSFASSFSLLLEVLVVFAATPSTSPREAVLDEKSVEQVALIDFVSERA